MRKHWKLVWLSLWLAPWMAGVSHGDTAAARTTELEQEIRRLDAQEADAVLRGDFALAEQLWADDFIVNNPSNTVGFARESPLRKGAVSYSSFERIAEFVALRGDVVIVMGREVVVQKAPSPNAGRALHRRYTNVWMKTARGWKLAARHANVIPAAPPSESSAAAQAK